MQFLKSQLPCGPPFLHLKKQIMTASAMMWNPLIYVHGASSLWNGHSQFYRAGGVFVTSSMEIHFEAEEPADTSWHPGPGSDFASVSINKAFPFYYLSRIAIFTCAPWSHLSEEGWEVGLWAPKLDKLSYLSVSQFQLYKGFSSFKKRFEACNLVATKKYKMKFCRDLA